MSALQIVEALVTAPLLILGCLLALLAAVGLHRFPDLFCRMHAATKPATLGMLLIAVAVGIRISGEGAVVKLLLVVALQFLTTPVAAHMVGRAAYRAGIEMSDSTVLDELGRDDDVRNIYGA
jgi:multicomponent Na+:H+ antiporter subunit G